MRIIAEQHLDHWSAWLAGEPSQAFGGDDAASAVERLCQAKELDCTAIDGDHGRCHGQHLEFVFGTACPDCVSRNTGRARMLCRARSGYTTLLPHSLVKGNHYRLQPLSSLPITPPGVDTSDQTEHVADGLRSAPAVDFHRFLPTDMLV